MSTGDAVVWILALAGVAAFYFAYGILEEFLQKRRHSPKVTKPKPTPSLIENALPDSELAPAIHGYDSPELFRHDTVLQVPEIDNQAAQHERNVHAILAEMNKRERGKHEDSD